MNSSIANVQVWATAPPGGRSGRPGVPLSGSNVSCEPGGVVMATPPPAGWPARAATARRSGMVIETVRFLVPSGSKNAASR